MTRSLIWDAPVGEHEHGPGRAVHERSVRVLDIGAADKAPSPPLILAVHGAADRRVDDSLLLDKLRAGSLKSAHKAISESAGSLQGWKGVNTQ